MTSRPQAPPILLLGLLCAMAPMAIDLYVPALPAIASSLETTPAAVGITLSANVAGLAVGQLLMGSLSDVLGRRRPLLAGLFVFALASLGCALASSLAVLTVLRFLQGLAGAAGPVLGRAIARDLYSGSRLAQLFGTLSLVMGIAPVCAPVLGGGLLRVSSWHGLFTALAVVGAVLALWSARSMPETLPPGQRTSTGPSDVFRAYGRLLGNRTFRAYALTLGALFAVLFAYVAGASFVLQNGYGLTPTAASAVFALVAAGMVAGGAATGRLARRTTPRRILAGATAVLVVAGAGVLAAAWAAAPLAVLLVPLLAQIAAFGFAVPCCTTLAMSGQSGATGSASALLGVTQFTTGALVTPLVGLGGADPALAMACVMTGAAVLAATGARLARRVATPGHPGPADRTH
ncbi:multidrug effflux MFS transporter [Streptomyces sp. LP05-1]|uniref:Multidrug effflux MFS transporter n=1 Tax=Streptomyces pyxinae TaxID=2970734 RepID=A0ABT2CBE7_9ACTN|nr:multidrug effflux MFS transporter [Streptomyces sp. LP05-1]MCS0634728.1 multidrug effflux MFS transporter [Streptomyces sp. LP05-1]